MDKYFVETTSHIFKEKEARKQLIQDFSQLYGTQLCMRKMVASFCGWDVSNNSLSLHNIKLTQKSSTRN